MAEPWTTEKIREAFIYDGGEAEYHDPINGAKDQRRLAGGIFDAWLAAHDAEKRAEWEAEQGEVQWEYGWSWADQPEGVIPYHPECSETERRELTANRSRRIAPVTNYRRKAGPWVPVNENGQTT